MTQSKTIQKKQKVTVTLSEQTADSIKASLEILKATFEAQEKAMVTQPSDGSEWIQKLLHKLDHRLDQDGKPTGLWL